MHSGKMNALLPGADSFFYCGKMTPDAGQWVSESLWKGLKLVLMMNGELECQPDNKNSVSLSGASLCVIANNHDEQESRQRFLQSEDIRFVSICLSDSLMEAFKIESLPLLTEAVSSGPQLLSGKAGNVLTALGNQILNNPLGGAPGEMYLTGKLLELCAYSFEHIQQNTRTIHHPKLAANDIRRLYEIRDCILADLANPPGVYQLSRQSGLNMRKLSFGFKQLFGLSVASFIQEERLQSAHRLLCAGDRRVSAIAWQVGYSPAAFSTAFRRRFGFSPKELC